MVQVSSAHIPVMDPAVLDRLHHNITNWYNTHQRDLPWRHPECSPWGILVSEVMLQQTPVARVLPRWLDWMQRWPEPVDLAQAPASEVLRVWDRLGYPRRALRLQSAAEAIVRDHGGLVPRDHAVLLSLPGIGAYTAAAVAVFAFGDRHTVVDTNIRRVHARVVTGVALPGKSLTAAETRLADALVPEDRKASVTWNQGVMELGALVCTARSAQCSLCPIEADCAWRAAGYPPPATQPRGQKWVGTDRQVRGAVMAVLRSAEVAVPERWLVCAYEISAPEKDCLPGNVHKNLEKLFALQAPQDQRSRALDGLIHDGLAKRTDAGIILP